MNLLPFLKWQVSFKTCLSEYGVHNSLRDISSMIRNSYFSGLHGMFVLVMGTSHICEQPSVIKELLFNFTKSHLYCFLLTYI